MIVKNKLKKIIKYRRFKRAAEIGDNLSVGPNSNCVAEKKGLIKIGNNCEILGALVSMADGKIEIGDYSEVRDGSLIGSVENVKIGNYVIISNNVRVYDNNNHPIDPEIRKQMCINGFYGDAWKWTHSEHKAVVIEDNVWIGEKVTILKGVTIGKGSIVGCNSVVTKDVPAYSIAAGNPAKIVKKITHEED